MKNKCACRLLSATVIALLLLVGCSSVQYFPSSSKTYSPTSGAAIYYWDKPDKPYVEMGRIEVKAQTEKGMLERFKEKAMEVGADGVFIKSVENKLRSDTQDADLWFLVKAPIRAEGVAIKFRDTSIEK